jgi:hypothetical protein
MRFEAFGTDRRARDGLDHLIAQYITAPPEGGVVELQYEEEDEERS